MFGGTVFLDAEEIVPSSWSLPAEVELLIRQARELPYKEAHDLLLVIIPVDTFIKTWITVLKHRYPAEKWFTPNISVTITGASSQGYSGVVTIYAPEADRYSHPYSSTYAPRQVKIMESSKRKFWTRTLLVVEACQAAGW